MTPVRMGMHALALELGMTVGRLSQEMTMREYYDWLLYFDRVKHHEKEPEKEAFDWSDPAAVKDAFAVH